MFKNIDIPNNIKIRFAIVTILLVISFFFIRHYRIFQPAAIVLAPNGGEVFEYGQTMQIRWAPGTPGIRLIEFVPVSGGSPIAVYNAPFSYTVADTSGNRPFNLSERIPAGFYYVRIYTANSYEFDQSDAPIQIKEFSKAIAPPPSVPIPIPSTSMPSTPTPSIPTPSTPTPPKLQGIESGQIPSTPSSPKTIPTREAVPTQKQLEQLSPSVQEKVAQEKMIPPVQKPVEHKSLIARTWSRVVNVFKSLFGI